MGEREIVSIIFVEEETKFEKTLLDHLENELKAIEHTFDNPIHKKKVIVFMRIVRLLIKASARNNEITAPIYGAALMHKFSDSVKGID